MHILYTYIYLKVAAEVYLWVTGHENSKYFPLLVAYQQHQEKGFSTTIIQLRCKYMGEELPFVIYVKGIYWVIQAIVN